MVAFCVSDIVLEGSLPLKLQEAAALYAVVYQAHAKERIFECNQNIRF